MIYVPAGWILGGVALLVIGRELNSTPKPPRPGGE